MTDSGITIDQGGRPSQEDILEENQARAQGTAWNDFDAGQRPAEWQADVDKARLTPETLRDATIRPESQSDSMRGMADFLKNRTMAKAGLQDAIQVEFPLMRGQDAHQGYSEARTEVSEGSQVPSPQELWNGLESFIKAPERPSNPATLAAWGTWNLANMGVEGGKKMWEAFKGLDEMIYGEGYQLGQEDEAGALAGIKVAISVASAGFAMPAPAGAIAMFAGRRAAETLAKTGGTLGKLPLKAMDKAEEMVLAGASDKEIRTATNEILKDSPYGGIHLGDDGQWRIEFSDRHNKTNEGFDYNFDTVMKPGEKVNYKLPDMFNMSFANSMGLKDNVAVQITKANPKLKNFSPSGRHVAMADGTHRITINAQDKDQVRDVLLHELQHAMQRREGFEYGGSPAQDSSYINPVQQKVFQQRLDASEDYNFATRQNEAIWKEASKDASKRGVKPAFKSKEWQTTEDMEGGFSFEQFSPHWQEKIAQAEKQVKDSFQVLQKEFPWDKSDRFLAYERLSGEVEARNVQKRKDWLPAERRDTHPRRTEDVPQDLKHQWSDFGDPADNLNKGASSSPARFAIFSQVKEVDKQIISVQKQIDRLQEQIKSERHPPGEIERKRNTLMSKHDRLKALQERKLALGVEAIQEPKPNLIQATIEEIKQGAPKTGTEDIGSMPQRRSKLERLTERVESLTTVIELETRIPRKERAQKELTKVLNELKFIGEGK